MPHEPANQARCRFTDAGNESSQKSEVDACTTRRFVLLCWRAAGGCGPWHHALILGHFHCPDQYKLRLDLYNNAASTCRGGIAPQLRTAGATNTSFESDRYTR